MKFAVLFMLFISISAPHNLGLDKPTYFIAMEYKGMSNCIYKVYVTDSLILAAKVNGYITVQPNFGIGTSIPFEKIHDPEAYVNKKMDRYDNLLSDHSAFLKTDKDNFIIKKSDIKHIGNDPTKKWGMGYYPHSGRIEIGSPKTAENRKGNRELILVGDQNPELILSLLK